MRKTGARTGLRSTLLTVDRLYQINVPRDKIRSVTVTATASYPERNWPIVAPVGCARPDPTRSYYCGERYVGESRDRVRIRGSAPCRSGGSIRGRRGVVWHWDKVENLHCEHERRRQDPSW
jgi:hypothetical protein